ncbi:hypothetical protein GCM10009527_035200 [Actinomadura nitritigenes]
MELAGTRDDFALPTGGRDGQSSGGSRAVPPGKHFRTPVVILADPGRNEGTSMREFKRERRPVPITTAPPAARDRERHGEHETSISPSTRRNEDDLLFGIMGVLTLPASPGPARIGQALQAIQQRRDRAGMRN